MADFLNSLVGSVDPYMLQILVNVGIAIVLALGLNVITGLTGQLSLGHAAFMSIGAFTSAMVTIKTGLPFVANLAVTGVVTAIVAAAIGFPILRLTGDYLAICTLGFAEIVKVFFLNFEPTNKALGLTVPQAKTSIPMPIYVWVVAILAIVLVTFVQNSRFGRALKAIREDEIAADAMGINTARYKIQAFALGSFMAGIGGGLYAHFLSYINPSDFGFLKSVDILAMVVLGGLGSVPGAVIGSSVLASAPEFLRFMSQYRMLVYGALLVFLMVFRPNGLLGGVNVTELLLRAIGRKPAGK
ncbi:branched-chain amino acid ABC transporter permease [Geomonas subterranea]|uniref:Branched-chain amino acid ABC transporter permease n=1 Tax=Geomonas subterranea TaxID=2847989 RepID=A0ABX8LM87_9BACT|nr:MULTISPECIES: branched-chain amino acid ABC transporter permease [Geomonas]QXE91739.1 branched-chain amino acid ABC transporter permease [Geomonas subterranea]QXM10168.1 branched-chain amino acid ABC transporter permease [Geomonas subterranea]